MRIWDISPRELCIKHLLGEHLELHTIWKVITCNLKGYSKHPETKRWVGKLRALHKRHDLLVEEMKRRGCNHKSELQVSSSFALGSDLQDVFINTIEEQVEILNNKPCQCNPKGSVLA